MNHVQKRIAANVESRVRSVVEDPESRCYLGLMAAKCFEPVLRRDLRPSVTRIRMTSLMLERVDYVARSLLLISRADKAVGQQALQIAAKARRALRDGRTTFGNLEDLAREFRSAKRGYELQNARTKPRAPRTAVKLVGGWSGTRVGTEQELTSLGRKFGNCLAAGQHSRGHLRSLRTGTCEYWTVNDDADEPRCILQIYHADRSVMEIKGPGNQAPYDSVDAVLDFLAKRKLVTGCYCGLDELGISDDLIDGVSTAQVQTLTTLLEEEKWKLRVMQNLLVANSTSASFTLRGRPEDECSYFSATHLSGYRAEAGLRCALRTVCSEDADLANTLAVAFQYSDPVMVRDWFGMAI